MKRFNIASLMAVLVLGLSVYLTACSGGGGGGGDTPGTTGGGGGGTTAISNNTQGTQAASSSTQGSSMAQGSGQTFQNLGSVGLSAMTGAPVFKTSKAFKPNPAMGRAIKMTEKLAKSRAANAAAGAIKRAKSATRRAPVATGSASCTNGGTASWNMTASDTGTNTFTFDITFANCKEGDTVIDGLYRVVATADSAGTGFNMTITLGPSAAFTISDYSSGGALIVKSTMTDFSLGIDMVTSGTNTSNLSMTSTMTASGTMNVRDYFSLEDYSITFTSFSTVFGMSATNFSITSNGNFSESWTDAAGANSVEASFSNLKLDITETAAFEDVDLSGSFTINFTPDACHEGTYSFVTSPKIRFDNNTGHTVAGVVTINGVTTVTFNTDGSITVATAGTSQTYNGEYDLEQVCPMATLDEAEPVSSGSGGTTSAANASMTITLTWDGPAGVSNSDMDLHMNYYATQAPTATTQGTWYIDYHSSLGNGCTNPVGVDLGFNNVDVDSDGICDIGLDFDNTSGYGPEHITATKLPAGYYVISVNDFGSSDATVPVNVSIQIGSSVFGPFTHTFATADVIADSDGASAGAWFGVADMVVDSAGNVTVKAHDTALELWHGGAFGMLFSPKRAKGL